MHKKKADRNFDVLDEKGKKACCDYNLPAPANSTPKSNCSDFCNKIKISTKNTS